MLRAIFFLFFLLFQLSFSSEIFLEKIELRNINSKYREYIKEFFKTNFSNIVLKKTKTFEYKLNVKIAMLSNIFSVCLEIYPIKEKNFYINCSTSSSLEEIPDTLKELSSDLLKSKKLKSKNLNLVIYTTNKKYNFTRIFILSNKVEIIIFDKKINEGYLNKNFNNLLKIYPIENEYNIFYLNEKDTLKLIKLIFEGYKINNIYIMEKDYDSSNSKSK